MSSSSAEKQFDPYELVAGDDGDWLNVSGSMKVALLVYSVNQLKRPAVVSRAGGSIEVRPSVARLFNKPQAVAKFIGSGGTMNARGMKAQMDYLRKDATVELERSDRYMGIGLDEEGQQDLMETWGVGGDGIRKSSLTSHFVASFPPGTDEDAAYQAGRDWAHKLFGSGEYGDVYDYYTAFHTDQKHPHMHVVVSRRGLENGRWLKVSKRSPINYDELRFAQVHAAGENGIELMTSPRASRETDGVPYPKFEALRAKAEGREPVRPEGNQIDLLKARVQRTLFKHQQVADAELIESKNPELGRLLKETIERIESGTKIKEDGPLPIKSGDKIGFMEIKKMNDIVEDGRTKILSNFEQIDQELSELPEGPEKTEIEKMAQQARKQAAEFMPEVAVLRDEIKPSPDHAYEGLNTYDDFTQEIADRANGKLQTIAEEAGLDPALIQSRYEDAEAAPIALAERWKQSETGILLDKYAMQMGLSPEKAGERAEQRVATVHNEIREEFNAARLEIDRYEIRKQSLTDEFEGSDTDRPDRVDEEFPDRVREVLTTEQIDRLDRGDHRALAGVSEDTQQQLDMAEHYLVTEHSMADMERQSEIDQSLSHLRSAANDHQKQLEKDRLAKDRLENDTRAQELDR